MSTAMAHVMAHQSGNPRYMSQIHIDPPVDILGNAGSMVRMLRP
jgi:hypothetical protein